MRIVELNAPLIVIAPRPANILPHLASFITLIPLFLSGRTTYDGPGAQLNIKFLAATTLHVRALVRRANLFTFQFYSLVSYSLFNPIHSSFLKLYSVFTPPYLYLRFFPMLTFFIFTRSFDS